MTNTEQLSEGNNDSMYKLSRGKGLGSNTAKKKIFAYVGRLFKKTLSK